MSTVAKERYTVEDYFEIEARTEYKNEYYQGEILAMAGATIAHNDIVANLIIAFGERLRGSPCRVMPSDTRIKCSTDLYTYSDALIVCGEREIVRYKNLETLLNPRVIFEVLSESTESYDRGKKFEHYQTIPSFQEYVLVAQDRPHADHFVRQSDDSWRLKMFDGLESTLRLASVDCELPLRAIFEGVELVAPAP